MAVGYVPSAWCSDGLLVLLAQEGPQGVSPAGEASLHVPAASDAACILPGWGGMCPEEGPCAASDSLRMLEPPTLASSAKGKICHLQAPEVVLPLPQGTRPTLLSWLVLSRLRELSRGSCGCSLSPFSPAGSLLLLFGCWAACVMFPSWRAEPCIEGPSHAVWLRAPQPVAPVTPNHEAREGAVPLGWED